ncbi:uncharacterized protein LOC128248170 [Octopus bimaculoides]|uniref:uncharacterized protein LOC128248170 n=1 Tax=Octopus bimaculoides TaxID=37653 RepID=UPI0022E1139A|nr:uncharacterized protein LOC128248170 [Octopus bimaculoides]XP_052825005.1 uncharacterized protein LOC128248170 [Octopus bimaculoides]XP_052825006.1 uncharacterized protein LOC128248170 [Octopus bimaculoides]XP_052825007.1 uncharacterized protein LOC128248170 [Octopus bimaculoides]
MYTYSLVLFAVLPLFVNSNKVIGDSYHGIVDSIVETSCSGCYYSKQCICDNQTVILRTEYDCRLIECKSKKIETNRLFCKDSRGNCMVHGQQLLGVYHNLCVTLFCSVYGSVATLSMRFNLVCMPEHVMMDILKFYYPPFHRC